MCLLALAAATQAAACGAKADLIIGRDSMAVTPDAGGGSVSGGSGGTGDTAGTSAGTSGSAGSSGTAGGGGLSEGGAAGDMSGGFAGALDCDPADVAPVGSLAHRYSFDGTGVGAGVVIKDLAGTDDAMIEEATPVAPDPACPAEPRPMLDGNGLLLLDGCKGYVDLHNHLVNVLSETTIMVWAQWGGLAGFQRYFDFGIGAGENNTSGQGQSFLAVSPAGLTGTHLQILARPSPTAPELQVFSAANMDDKKEHQIAVVFVSNSYVELYRDGVRLQHAAVTWPLSAINDVNEWIGRSQWMSDHTFNGTIDEVRIYSKALTECAMRAAYTKGPDSP